MRNSTKTSRCFSVCLWFLVSVLKHSTSTRRCAKALKHIGVLVFVHHPQQTHKNTKIMWRARCCSVLFCSVLFCSIVLFCCSVLLFCSDLSCCSVLLCPVVLFCSILLFCSVMSCCSVLFYSVDFTIINDSCIPRCTTGNNGFRK